MRRPPTGFTLLEVIVALAILTLGISSALALFTAATAAHKRAIDRVNAAAIAEHAIADIESALARGSTVDELRVNPPFDAIRNNWPGYEVGVEFTPATGANAEDLMLLELTIRFGSDVTARAYRFRQLLTREILVK